MLLTFSRFSHKNFRSASAQARKVLAQVITPELEKLAERKRMRKRVVEITLFRRWEWVGLRDARTAPAKALIFATDERNQNLTVRWENKRRVYFWHKLSEIATSTWLGICGRVEQSW